MERTELNTPTIDGLKAGATVEEKIIVTFLRKMDRLKSRLSETTSAAGVTPQQYNILRILRGAGDDGLPTLEIGKRMLEHSPGITRLIDRLEAKGLVERRRSVDDRRCVPCFITAQGNQVLDELETPIRTYHQEMTAGLTNDEKNLLLPLLEKL